MWRETKILLIDDDSARRRDLAVVLRIQATLCLKISDVTLHKIKIYHHEQ